MFWRIIPRGFGIQYCCKVRPWTREVSMTLCFEWSCDKCCGMQWDHILSDFYIFVLEKGKAKTFGVLRILQRHDMEFVWSYLQAIFENCPKDTLKAPELPWLQAAWELDPWYMSWTIDLSTDISMSFSFSVLFLVTVYFLYNQTRKQCNDRRRHML